VPGEGTVLLGFHALWLTPYGGRYRNTSVTLDRRHHAAHFWVDRFAVPCAAEEQVHHLLWVIAKLHEVVPVLHARFGGATMAQKYGGLLGDTSEPFVLGGNPLIAVYARGGDGAVDAWIASQTDWSNEELAQMLRELAVELVTGEDDDEEDGDVQGDDEIDAIFDAAGIDSSDDDEDDDEDAADDEEDDEDDEADDDDTDDDDDDDEEDEGDEPDRGRHITAHAGEVLLARARAGLLDPRVAAALRPVLDAPA